MGNVGLNKYDEQRNVVIKYCESKTMRSFMLLCIYGMICVSAGCGDSKISTNIIIIPDNYTGYVNIVNGDRSITNEVEIIGDYAFYSMPHEYLPRNGRLSFQSEGTTTPYYLYELYTTVDAAYPDREIAVYLNLNKESLEYSELRSASVWDSPGFTEAFRDYVASR